MKITKSQLRRIVRESKRTLLRESVHSQLDAELTNLVFVAAQELDVSITAATQSAMPFEGIEEITAQDVDDFIGSMPNQKIAMMVDPNMSKYFVEAARAMTYEDIVDRMYQLVEMGELTGGYEDFFGMAK